MSEICWLCGKEFTKDNIKTGHHVIPKRLNPVTNIKIPLHRECHNKVELPEKAVPASLKTKAHNVYQNSKTIFEAIKDMESL